MWLNLLSAAACVMGSVMGGGTTSTHPGHDLHEWTFVPASLATGTNGAAGTPGLKPFEDPTPATHAPMRPLEFKDLTATDRRLNLLGGEHLPTGPFTCEVWINHHVSQPVGVVVAARDGAANGRAAWLLGFHDDAAMFAAGPDGSVKISSPVAALAHREHWYHLAAVYTGEDLQLFVNGRQFGGVPIERSLLATGANSRLEIAAYLEHEPQMKLGHLVTHARLYDEALTPAQIAKRFAMMKVALEQGWVHPGRMHLTAGPYLTLNGDGSVRVLWETDRPARGVIQWGEDDQLSQRIDLNAPMPRLQHATLAGLRPATTYSYRVQATDAAGEVADSGVLTFRTTPAPGQPARLCAIGGSQPLPHINDHLARHLHTLRPDLIVNLGSLTDGGGKDHKHLWNLEYFRGMGALNAWVPAAVLPGQGEAERSWFDHFHPAQAPQGCTAMRCGDATVFMLPTSPGSEQEHTARMAREWLTQQLAASRATWNIVCHHAPFFTSAEPTPQAAATISTSPLPETFDALGIDLVLSSSTNGFERTVPIRAGKESPTGPIYVNTGGAGTQSGTLAASKPWFRNAAHPGHHFLELEITAQSLRVNAKGLDGSIIDTMTLTKPVTPHKTGPEAPSAPPSR